MGGKDEGRGREFLLGYFNPFNSLFISVFMRILYLFGLWLV